MSSTARRQDIEALRLLACWGIVSFHLRPTGAAWAYGGLVAFVVLSVWLGGSSTRPPDMATVRRRAQRLLLPWALWFIVYASINAARGGDALPAPDGLLAATLAGPSIHLWYLPFMFGALLLLDVLRAHIAPRTLAAVAGVLALLVTATVPWWRPVSLQLHYPVLQWCDAIGPVLFGVFLAGMQQLDAALRRTLLAGIAMAVAWVCTQEWVGPSLLLGYAATAVLASGRTSTWLRADLTPLSSCTFGIYLAHSAVALALLTSGVVRPDALPEALLPEAVLLLALAGTWLLRRWLPRVAASFT